MRLEKPHPGRYYSRHKARYLCWINQILKEIAMRLYAPLYEGDSILRPDAALGERAVANSKSTAPTATIVHSNIPLAPAHDIAHMAKALFVKIAAWLERNENNERDNFFAASENLADLEQRQRHFERTGIPHY
jgi:hypothetical protein